MAATPRRGGAAAKPGPKDDASGAPASRRLLSTLLWVAGAVAVAAGWWLGVPRLRDHARSGQAALVVDVEFREAPAWATEELLGGLRHAVLRRLDADPFDREGLVAARAALADTGWFADVRQVRRLAPGRIVVDAQFVDPFVVVRDRDGDHVVDRDGRLVPRTFAPDAAPEFVVIRGAFFDRPRRPGEIWPGADIAAALALCRTIEDRPWRRQVRGIQVSEYAQREVLYMVTDRGHRILWGRPPGAERPGEASLEQKLLHLDFPHEHFGHIDGGYDGDLDISTPIGIVALAGS
jgi:hypothetical protein